MSHDGPPSVIAIRGIVRSVGNLAGTIVGATIIAMVLGVLGPSKAFGQATPAQGTKAQDEKPPPTAAPSSWSFRLSPYLWLAGINGKVGVRSNLPALNVDVGFSGIFHAIDWFPPPVMRSGEVRYGRFGFVSDFIYLGLADSGGRTRGPISATADVNLNIAIWTFGGSYRVIENDPVTVDLLAGGRFWNMDGRPSSEVLSPCDKAVRARPGSIRSSALPGGPNWAAGSRSRPRVTSAASGSSPTSTRRWWARFSIRSATRFRWTPATATSPSTTRMADSSSMPRFLDRSSARYPASDNGQHCPKGEYCAQVPSWRETDEETRRD